MPDFSTGLLDTLVQRELSKEQPTMSAPTQALSSEVPERKGNPWWAKAAVYGANMADAESTRQFRDYEKKMGLGNSEGNPIGRLFVDNTPAMFGIKAGSSALQNWMYDKLAKAGHPNIAKLAALASAGFTGSVAANNFRNVNRWKDNNPRWREGIRGK